MPQESMDNATRRAVLWDQLYICQNVDVLPEGDGYKTFVPDESIQYHPLCDDFGPMNLASVVKFIQQLDAALETESSPVLFYCVDSGKRALTNAIFLLGAYMILRLKQPVDAVLDSFSWADHTLVEPFRDATFSRPDFGLTLADCWGGLARGIQLGWVDLPSSEDEEYLWGSIDVDEYEHYDDPLNGDMHEVVPGKFIAFKGPVDVGDALYHDDERGYRSFSPDFYASIFQDFGVTAVVRLNEPLYNGRRFEESGVALHELEFEDCTAPPAEVVEEFLRIADGTDGAVAVHCKAGLGRTGTLIGVYLMRRHGFTGREAMGWLRMLRPGSVIGEQQHYLCGALSSGVQSCRYGSSELAGQVAAGMQRRASRRASFAGLADGVCDSDSDTAVVSDPIITVAGPMSGAPLPRAGSV